MRTKWISWSVFPGFLLGMCLTARSQPPVVPQPAQIEAGFFNPEGIQVFFIGDLGLREGARTSPVFYLRLINPDPDEYGTPPQPTPPRRATLCLKVERSSNTGETQELASGCSDPFELDPGVTEITNLDLFSLRGRYSFDLNVNEAAEDLIQGIIETGKLPAGVYHFSLVLTDLSANDQDETTISLNISGQETRLDLLSPGLPATEELPLVYTPYPLFRWESNATRFELTVAEATGAPGETPQSAIEADIVLQKKIYVRRPGDSNPLPEGYIESGGTFYQYPPTNERSLIENKTYYWRVVALVPTSSDPENPERIQSDIWGFRIASIGSMGPAELQVRAFLRSILPTGLDYQRWFGPGGPLAGYTPTGVVTRNLAPIPLDELQQLQQAFLSGRIRVVNISVIE